MDGGHQEWPCPSSRQTSHVVDDRPLLIDHSIVVTTKASVLHEEIVNWVWNPFAVNDVPLIADDDGHDYVDWILFTLANINYTLAQLEEEYGSGET